MLAAAARGRPAHAVNLTLYHVGPASHPGLSDVNSGDAAGDAFFMLRAAGLPWLCSNSSGQKDETFDCRDVEQSGPDLLVSEYVVEADARFSGYAECNTDNGTAYYCECRDRSGGGGFGPDRRRLQHHHHTDVPCNATVGRIAVMNESSFASQAPDPSQPHSFLNSPYRFWYYNLAHKLPSGTWFSTLSKGECVSRAVIAGDLWAALFRESQQ